MKINLTGIKNIKVYGLMGLIILVLLMMIIGIGRSYFDSPAVGIIQAPKTDTSNKMVLLSFQGKTFSLSYPNIFMPSQASPATGSDIEKYAFVASQTATWNMNIKITTLAQNSLSYDGSYNLRKTDPQTYTEEEVTLGSNDAHIMTSNTGGYNKVVFLINGKIDATILLISSSSIDSAKMDAALNEIISSWKWL